MGTHFGKCDASGRALKAFRPVQLVPRRDTGRFINERGSGGRGGGPRPGTKPEVNGEPHESGWHIFLDIRKDGASGGTGIP